MNQAALVLGDKQPELVELFPTSNLEAHLQLHWHCVGVRAVASSHRNDVLL